MTMIFGSAINMYLYYRPIIKKNPITQIGLFYIYIWYKKY